VKTNYIRTLNIDEPLSRVSSTTTRHYVRDALGSTVALADDTGVTKTTYVYDAFGNVTTTGEASDNPFQYTARENDGTGLLYYRYRYYSPEMQRFISEDPIRLRGGINYFSYVQNNPVNFTDPTGQFIILLAGPAAYTGTMALADLTIAAATSWWLSQQVKTPNTGDLGTWVTNPGSGQERRYGPDGRPSNDIDWDHDHGNGVPHGHNWPDGKRDKGNPLSPWPKDRKPCKN